MRDFFSTLTAQVRELWQGLNTLQRSLFVGVPAAVIILVIVLIGSLPTSYTMLYGNLSETDRLDIERELITAGIPFETNSTTSTVSVDGEYVSRARMLLAIRGLPRPASEGYKIFDRQKLGATEREQRINFVRALSEELQSAINSLDTIRTSRILLTIPEPSVFTEKQQLPKASVILTFQQASRPEDEEVQGIALLVAGAVDGLVAENVVVTDSRGAVISKISDEGAVVLTERRALRALEEEPREQKINEILMQTYGNLIGSNVLDDAGEPTPEVITAIASVHVTADLDHGFLETETTRYDPETIVSTEQITSESSEGVPIPSAVGVPGVTSNILGAGQVSGSGTYSREDSTTQYEAGITRTIAKKIPELVSLSTAVVVNAAILDPATILGLDLSDRTVETVQMRQIRMLIAGAIGYTAGHPVILEPIVQFMQFVPLPGPIVLLPTGTPAWWLNPWIIAGILGAVVLGLVGFLLVKPRLARVTASGDEAEALPGVDEEELQALLARQREALEEEERDQHRRRRQALVDLAEANPEEIARVVRHWGDAN
jgi:flagellar M-ring protein FliF